jgi:2Fe-2S ferredoxin
MPKVTFLPENIELECPEGGTIFATGREHGIAVDTACVGKGTCGLCRVKIIEGEEFLSDYNAVEEKHLGNVYFLTKIRLSCQCVVHGGNVVVELAPKKKKRPKPGTGS